MPVIIAQILRQVIMAVATGAIVTGGQQLIDGTAKEAVDAVADAEGLTKEESKDIVGNILVDLALNSALVFATLKTGAGVKAAETLGLTSRGLTKKTLTGKATKAVTNSTAKAGSAGFVELGKKIMKPLIAIGGSIWLVKALADIIEPGIYQPAQTNAIYKKLGIPFQYPVPKAQLQPGPFDNKSFAEYATAVESAGVKGIENPGARQTQIYSREALADLVEWAYGQEVIKGSAPSSKQLIPKLAQYFLPKGVSTPSSTTTGIVSTTKATSTPIKVFTGVVSQGVLGDKLVFTPRENDLIEDVAELNDSAHNNLVPFLTSLPSRVTYELKIVSSVVTSDGFRRVGTTQRVVTGTYANGQPKYKTVTNKFAVLDLFIKTSTGSRTKLSSIVLGPVDSARFQITNSELASLAVALQGDIVTTRLADVQNVSNNNNSSLQTNTSQNIETVTPLQTPGLFRSVGDFGTTLFARIGNRVYATNLLVDELVPNRTTVGNAGKQAEIALATLQKKYQVDFNRLPAQNMGDMSQDSTIIKVGKAGPEGGPDPFVTSLSFTEFAQLRDTATVEYSQESVAKNATNLRDYFKAFGQEIPSIEVRGQQYESLGLGQAIYYTGTAEQNTKLLAKLQGK
ncbi:MAG: hypothetical protein ACYCZW_00700 [Minisyncoccota bacterium]